MLGAFGLSAGDAAADDDGIIVRDDFSSKSESLKIWNRKGGTIDEAGKKAVLWVATLKEPLPQDQAFRVSIDVTIDEEGEDVSNNARTGFLIGEYACTVSSHLTPFIGRGGKKIEGLEYGVPFELAAEYTPGDDVATIVSFVNGKKIGSRTFIKPDAKLDFLLYPYCKCSFRNFKVVKK